MILSISHPPSHPFRSTTPSPSSSCFSSLHLKKPKPFTHNCLSPRREAAGKSAIQRISEKLRSLGYLPEVPAAAAEVLLQAGHGSAGEIFIPTPNEIPKHRVGHTIDPSWSTPEHPVPEPGASDTITRFRELWKRDQESLQVAVKEVKMPMAVELTLPRNEVKRLTTLGIALRKRLKVGKAGITEGILNGIHERWRRSEVVKIRCEDICRMNMKRTHEILERKTGGLVVWRSGNTVILYRGLNYKYPYFHSGEQKWEKLDDVCFKPTVDGIADKEQGTSSSSTIAANTSIESSVSRVHSPFVAGVGSSNKLRLQLPGETQLEEEADRLLDGLGPRFTDWWGYDPLPVDADLLAAVVPGFRKPFRLLPFGLKPKLTDRESTILRRLSRHIPCHFALGRNRNLQGLAVSIIKLWEKCEVAKIAIKRGAQNTNTEIMAEDLKKLTGGILLSKDKDYIVLYRGKDFLPPAVSIAIEERRRFCGKKLSNDEKPSFVESLSSRRRFTYSSGIEVKEIEETKRPLITVRSVKSASSTTGKVEAKLTQANRKIEKTEKQLEKLERLIEPTTVEVDKESISEEERFMLRRVGLRMKPYLLLGRRGVFDGTIENMHLHWKYRELVKIIFNDKHFENAENTARILEAESGGILVAVERVNKGYAAIIYRGKNYRRPANLRPQTLLNKKEALKRSLEAQRYESLKLHALNLSKTINRLDHKADNDLNMKALLLNELEGPRFSNELIDEIEPLSTENDSGSEPEIESYLSSESDYNGKKIEEVNETKVKSFQLNDYENNFSGRMETVITPNLQNTVDSEHQAENCKTEMAEHFSVPIKNISMSDIDGKSLESDVLQDQTSNITICRDSSVSEELFENLSCGGAQSLGGLSPLESNGDQKDYIESIYRSAPLSNRERLILRKQALSMKKRPVLSVGKSNFLIGVAKTIKTHFRKHPLAIVNIKGRAKGTSVQELVFELEQATGSVLVSREPNKVILYRGWGEGDRPGCIEENGAGKVTKEVNEGLVSHQLIEAIRRECGLPSPEA